MRVPGANVVPHDLGTLGTEARERTVGPTLRKQQGVGGPSPRGSRNRRFASLTELSEAQAAEEDGGPDANIGGAK